MRDVSEIILLPDGWSIRASSGPKTKGKWFVTRHYDTRLLTFMSADGEMRDSVDALPLKYFDSVEQAELELARVVLIHGG